MDNAEYHSMTDLQSSTMLKTFYRDISEYHRKFVEKSEAVDDLSGKPQVVIGDLVHQVLLDKRELDEIACVYPNECFKSNMTLNPKPAKEYRLAMEEQGKKVLRDDDWKRVIGCCNAVANDELNELITMNGVTFEEPLFWTDHGTGIECKARPDFMYVDERHVACWDLKVTEAVAPNNWERIAKKLLYWLQDAHYSSGLAHAHGKPVAFSFWVIESIAPHRIVHYQFDPISRERASEAYVKLLHKLKECRDESYWKEDWEEMTQMLTLNPWDIRNSEEELEGFDGETIQA